MSLLDNLPHTCKVQRMKYSRVAGQVGNVEIPKTVLGDDPEAPLGCWVQNANSREIIEWEKRDVSVTHRVSFTKKEDIRLRDEIQITSGPGFVGDLYRVQTRPIDRSAGKGVLFVVYVEVER